MDEESSAPTSQPRHKVEVNLTGTTGYVTVDGLDLSHVLSGLSLFAAAGELPKLYLDVRPGVDVHVIADQAEVNAGPETAEWLVNLDGAELDRAVLERIELGSGSPGTVALEVLAEWASGQTSSAPTEPEFPSL